MKLSKVKIAAAAISAAGLTLFVSQAAQANNQYVQQIVRQLAQAAVLVGYQGSYRMTHNPFVDTLSSHGQDMITVNLRSGVAYGLIGVCDNDCGDVDLKLYDENYHLIDTDTSAGDVPVVSVQPRWSGKYYVEVDMESCRTNYCYYGVGVFGR